VEVEKQFDMLAGSHYLSLRSLCNLQQAWLEIIHFWQSNGNPYLIRNTRNKSDFHAGTWPRGNVCGTQSNVVVCNFKYHFCLSLIFPKS